ncbi:zinc finger protein 343-like [Culex quinquefasciatus]|uniref:zinc finger protein 343-like n=3 Tax=Culex pipiens complex TaxID=518105 RepID=UPI0018E36177|nr:zinc finger protein 343-like [Culex quinquefasciatus]
MCVRHIWRHNLQKPEFFVCGTCQKQFNKRSNLVRHEAMHEREKAEPPKPKKPPKFHCDKCQRPFWKRHNLNRHQLVHDKEEANSKGQTIEAYLKS